MRTFSFILAFGFAFIGTSFSAPADSGMPGAGTFSYGSPAETITQAHLTLTIRTRA